MGSVHLESWVKQQYKEIGFEVNQPLSNAQKRIRQFVNAIKHQDISRGTVSASQPQAMLSQTKKISQSPATPLLLESPLKSKIASRSPTRPQPKQAPPSIGSDMSAASSQGADSGFASGAEDAQNSMSRESWRPRTTPAINFQIHSPGSEDGGATLEAFPSNVSTSRETAETLGTLGTLVQGRSNPKVLELKKFLDEMEDFDSTLQGKTEDALSMLNLQLGLLNFDSATEGSGEEPSTSGVRNAVLFSGDVLGYSSQIDHPQYGLLGSSSPAYSTTISDSRLFLNTNIPFSAFVCGVQGSGKSHTTACMIENCLIQSPVLGVLQKPLSALVFNFTEYASGSSFRPCELAFLASPGSQLPNNLGVKKVNVLVSPSNYPSMKALYTQIPGVTVKPFTLHPKDLNISIMLTLMSVNQTQATPLYMRIVTKILRNLASEAAVTFNYPEFRRRLGDAGLDRKQEEFLNQRLDLLESFLDLDGSTTSPTFAAGEISIIDLSCPFMDGSTACVLFKIGMGLYLESDLIIGKVIVLDEAYKYMTDTPASKALTESLMGVIRQQRHYGARVIISTQEPSISPKLIDLCPITVVHRFSSPEWFNVLRRHIPLLDKEGDGGNKVGLLREIMRLTTGEALVFAPSAIFGTRERRICADKLFKMRMRKRVTWDGGRSIVCI